MQHFVYILKSINFNRYYVGYTIDIGRRVAEHNIGNTKSTRPFKPWRVIYKEVFQNKSEAYRREWHLKHTKGRKEKLEIISKYGGIA